MKKKLLTVLLAVVMVFGVFSLTACGAKENPADDYNYYRSVYSSLKDEEDIRIHSMVFMQLTMMLRTPGQYLIYTGGAWDSKAQANIKAVNDIAKAYDVQVYNLDLRLDGGISMDSKLASNYKQEKLKDNTVVNYADGLYVNSSAYRDASSGEAVETVKNGSAKVASIREALQQYLGTYESHGLKAPKGLTVKDIPEAALISLDVTGAPSSTSTTVAQYKIWDEKATKDADNAGKYLPGWINFTMTDAQMVGLVAKAPTSSLAAFNADITSLNLKNAAGEVVSGAKDVYAAGEVTNTSTSYSVTVKEGAIGSNSKDLEKVVQSIALTVPSFGSQIQSGGDHGTGPYDASGFDASVIDSFDYFGDYRLHMAGDYDTATDGFLEGTGSVYEVITLHEFIDILKNVKEGDFNVFFGGAWCPNTQSIAKITSEMAQDYGINRIFFFDPNLDGSASVYIDGQSVSTGMNIRTSNQEAVDEGKPSVSAVDQSNMTFSGLYAYLLDTIKAGGQEYTSYWNTQWKSDMLGKGNRYQLFINGEIYTRMCVPNIMGFTGTDAGAKLEIWKEAEYYWADTSVADSPVRIAWDNAIKEVFEANDYAVYNPIMRVEETPAAEEEDTGSASSGGSTTTAPPAAGGC